MRVSELINKLKEVEDMGLGDMIVQFQNAENELLDIYDILVGDSFMLLE